MGRYIVWQPSRGESEHDGARVSATSPRQAVEEWADNDDFGSNEYHIVGGQTATVVVLDLDSATRGEWTVSGRSQRVYTAKPIIQ